MLLTSLKQRVRIVKMHKKESASHIWLQVLRLLQIGYFNQYPKINLLKTKIFNVGKILKIEIQTLFNYYIRYFSLNNIVMDVLKKISKKSINNNINILKNVIKIGVYIFLKYWFQI